MKDLAKSLRLWRDSLGKTQQEAADFLFVPVRTYQEWEQGRRAPKQAGPLRKVIELSKRTA